MTTRPHFQSVVSVAAILCAGALLTFNDALVKIVQTQVGLWALFWLRALITVPFLGLVLWLTGRRFLPDDWPLVMVRSVLVLASWLTLYSSFYYLPIANAVGAAYTNPIMIVVMTAFLSGQKMPLLIWLSVIIGFVGVIMIIQPGAGGASWAYVLPILAALTYAAAMVLTNRKLAKVDPIGISFWMNLTFMIIGALATFAVGGNPVESIGILIGPQGWPFWIMGLAIGVGGVLVAFAYQRGPAIIVATFDYFYLVFAVLWGFVLFREMPDMLAFMGMSAVVCAGLLTLWSSPPSGSD